MVQMVSCLQISKRKQNSLARTLFPSCTGDEEAVRDGGKADSSFKEIPVIKSRFIKSQEPKDFGSMTPKTFSVTPFRDRR